MKDVSITVTDKYWTDHPNLYNFESNCAWIGFSLEDLMFVNGSSGLDHRSRVLNCTDGQIC